MSEGDASECTEIIGARYPERRLEIAAKIAPGDVMTRDRRTSMRMSREEMIEHSDLTSTDGRLAIKLRGAEAEIGRVCGGDNERYNGSAAPSMSNIQPAQCFHRLWVEVV